MHAKKPGENGAIKPLSFPHFCRINATYLNIGSTWQFSMK